MGSALVGSSSPDENVNQSTNRLKLLGYGVAIVSVGVTVALRWFLQSFLHQHAPLMLFILPAIAAARVGGLAPGLFAVVLGLTAGDFLFLDPLHTLGPQTPVELVYWFTFLLEAGTAVLIVDALRRSRERADKAFGLAQNRGEQLRRSLREIGEAEAKIRELANVVETAQDSIVSCNLQGEITSWNSGAEKLFGYRASEVLGKPLRLIIPTSRYDEADGLYSKLKQGQRIEAFETVRVAKDGRELDVSVSFSPVLDSRGEISGAASITRDITALKRANAALRKSEQRLQTLADNAPIMICEMDPGQQCTWVNKNWLLFTGRELAAELGGGWTDFIHPEDRERCLEAHRKAVEMQVPCELEYRLRRADGEYRWIHEKAVPSSTPEGVFVGYLRSCIDMTERRQAEEALDKKFDELRAAQQTLREQNQQLAFSRSALEAERSRYRELFNSAPVGYIITTPQGVIQQVNTAAATLLNETPEMLEGLPFARFLSKEARPLFFERLNRLTRREADLIESWETALQPHAGAEFPCSLLANRVEDQAGKLTGLRWILRDTSERKQAEEKILRLNAELEERVRQRTAALEAANRELEAFSYSVSHDLRAPVRSITGFSKALLEDFADRLDEEGRRYLQYAHEAGLRMSRLIDDLIELSRATRGELRQQEIDLTELTTLVVAELRKRDPGRSVEVLIAPGLIVHGDQGLLRIALENLLANAWKFTARQPQPRIEVGSCVRKGVRAFFIRDNGAGFNMQNATRLFGVFQRLHSQEDFPGTGIGLATVRRIFTRHGGEIWAESEVNQGATFYFTLPNGFAAEVEDQRAAA